MVPATTSAIRPPVQPLRAGGSAGAAGSPATEAAGDAEGRLREPVPLGTSLVEPERRVLVAHEQHVGGHARDPPVEPDNEVEEPARVTRGEEQRHTGKEHEDADQPGFEADAPEPLVDPGRRVAAPSQEDSRDDVLRYREEPPLHQHEAAGELLRVGDLQARRVVGHVVERERRIAIGAQRAVGVERHPPRPAENADVEVEDATRVAAGEEDREERDDRQNEQREPEQREHDVVRDREDPLHEPEPAAQLRVQLSLDADWIRLRSVHPSPPR